MPSSISLTLLPLLFAAASSARDISFPPLSPLPLGYQQQQQQNPLLSANGGNVFGDGIADAPWAGLTTFANLPHVHCLAGADAGKGKGKGKGEAKDGESFDIAVLGAPFDTGVTARPGARFGPTGIRLGSRRLGAGYNIYTGESTYNNWARIVDCGDVPLTFLDNTVALRQLDRAHKVIAARKTNASSYTTPKILTLGGDHTTTLSALRSTFEKWGSVSVIHFDSHIDTWDPEVLGGGISHYAGVNHGTFLHIAHEEGLIRNTSIHAGIRAPVLNRHKDLDNDARCGFEMVKAREIDRIGIDGLIERLKSRVAGSKVYISVDIDVLDPAFAPATGTAEPGGWSTRELLSILDGLTGLQVIGADVVEVAPVYDNVGEPTTLAAAQVADSLLTLMVQTHVGS
ncbi:arginase family-domain-containing protein [Phyllosticta paracitricarpa]|uniref:Arginase family-domain-containing protein n=1 Tax=Phyllosticta paracitricarpa TaxID=2016321 RepID=A0ABR1MS72_9PEZI